MTRLVMACAPRRSGPRRQRELGVGKQPSAGSRGRGGHPVVKTRATLTLASCRLPRSFRHPRTVDSAIRGFRSTPHARCFHWIARLRAERKKTMLRQPRADASRSTWQRVRRQILAKGCFRHARCRRQRTGPARALRCPNSQRAPPRGPVGRLGSTTQRARRGGSRGARRPAGIGGRWASARGGGGGRHAAAAAAGGRA